MTQSKLVSYRRSATELPSRTVRLLLSSPHAPLIARSKAEQLAVLPEIASLHTKQELAQIVGLGPVVIRSIETWARRYGWRLRAPNESLDAAVCRLSFGKMFHPASTERLPSKAGRQVRERAVPKVVEMKPTKPIELRMLMGGESV